jgi:hypothetical protein
MMTEPRGLRTVPFALPGFRDHRSGDETTRIRQRSSP